MFESRTAETIRSEMLADLAESTGLSTVPGGYLDTILGRVATELAKVYASLEVLPSMVFPDEASGTLLDLYGETYFDLPRKSGAKARADITLTGTAGATIPEGTVFLTATGLEFALMEDVTLSSAGQGTGTVEAVEVGAAYNIAAATLTRMYINLVGLSTWSNSAASGGVDRESDAAYHARINARRKRPPTSGNVHHYRQWALEVPGVGAAKVIPLANGAGTVGILLVSPDMAPAAASTVAAVTAHIDAERPVGAQISVSAPESVSLAVSATVTVSAGTTAAAVKTAFEAALSAYLRSIVQTKYETLYTAAAQDTDYKVIYNRVAALLIGIDGVVDFTALTIGGVAADYTVPANKVPVLGTVTIS